MTIYDIAKQAGVSASTVSRVINRKPGISEATRRKVQKLLEENNYTPDVTARGLVMQSSWTVGILIEDIRVSLHTDAVYIIEQELMEHGYTCITLSTGRSLEKKLDFIRLLEQRRVEGVIMIGSMFGEEENTDGRFRREVASHLGTTPIVLVNGELKLPNVWCIISDEERGTEESVAYLVRKQRKRISYLTDVDTPSNHLKRRGYFSGCMKYAPDMPTQLYQAPGSDTNPTDSVARGREAAKEMCRLFPDTDAILCSTDMMAIGCMQGLKDIGKNIPGDIAVMGVDNALFGQLLQPTLTTLDNKMSECSRNAARMLLDALDGREPSRKIIIPAEIIERDSA